MGLGAGSEEGTRGAPAEPEPVRTLGCAASADTIQPGKASLAGARAHRPACWGQVVWEEHPTGLHVTILVQVCEIALVEPVRRCSSDVLVSSSQFESTCPSPPHAATLPDSLAALRQYRCRSYCSRRTPPFRVMRRVGALSGLCLLNSPRGI